MNKYFFFILMIALSGTGQLYSAPRKDLKCPEVLSTLGPEAVAYKTYSTQGYQVLVCVMPLDLLHGELRKKHLFQFDAHLFKKDVFIKTLFSGNLKTPILFERKNGILFENMYLNILENYYPLYQSKLNCQHDDCQKENRKCIFKQSLLPAMSPKDFMTEKEVLAKAERATEEIASSEMFDMLQIALRGREAGIRFFTKLDKQPKFNSATLENYKSIQKLLAKMVLEDCLKFDAAQE